MQPSILHRLFWGLVLVAVGVVFLLNQTGTVSVDIGWIFGHLWPVFIILFGLQGLLVQKSGGFLWNIIVILVGFVFLGRNLEWFSWNLGDLFRFLGPIILIAFGINMILRGGRTKPANRHEDAQSYGWNPVTPPSIPVQPAGHQGPPPAPPLSDDPNASFTGTGSGAATAGIPAGPSTGSGPSAGPGYQTSYPPLHHDREERRRQRMEERRRRMEERRGPGHAHRHGQGNWWNSDPNSAQHHRFIGDVHIGHDYWELRPMSISHFIGDTTLDLTKAQIPLGETRIYVSCFIGDVKVFVPNDLGIGIQVVSSSLIGDVKVLDHKRGGFFNQMSVETPSYSDTDKRVVLIASAFIGDVRVTKVG